MVVSMRGFRRSPDETRTASILGRGRVTLRGVLLFQVIRDHHLLHGPLDLFGLLVADAAAEVSHRATALPRLGCQGADALVQGVAGAMGDEPQGTVGAGPPGLRNRD